MELAERRSAVVPVALGLLALAIVVAWLLLGQTDQALIDTAVGVARK